MICVPIKEKKLSKLIATLKEAQLHGDLTEIWFDEMAEKGEYEAIGEIFKLKKKPMIYKSYGAKESIFKLLKYPIDYIDLDFATSQSLIKEIKAEFPKLKIIISHHNFKNTPALAKLKQIADKIHAKGADVIKIATRARKVEDSFKIFQLLECLSTKKRTAICLAMGSQGRLTRLAGHLFGNYLMYCPLTKGKKTADGQLTIKELCHLKSVS